MNATVLPNPIGSALYKQVLESIDIDVVVFDVDLRYCFANESAIRNPDVRAWIIGKTDAEYCAYRDKPVSVGERRMAAQRHVLATGVASTFEEELIGRDGQPVHLVRRICPIRENGRVVGLIGYGFDITELRRDQQALLEGNQQYAAALRAMEESEARFRLVSRATNDVVWDWSIDDGRIWWNDTVQSVFGHSTAELGDSVDGWTRNIHEDDRERVMLDVEEAMQSDAQSWQGEYRFRRADGSWASVFDRGYIIRDEVQRPVRMIGAMQDQTDRHALEAQLRQAQKMEAVGQLAAGVAHDFNNIMTAVSSYAELIMQDAAPDSAIRADAMEIQQAGRRARELTHQLLAFSRKQVLQPDVLNVNEVLRTTENLLRRSLGGRLALTMRLTSDALTVTADRGQLVQVAMNLVLNARDAMGDREGEVIVETAVRRREELTAANSSSPPSVRRELTAPRYAELTVRDRGVGMDEETQRRIFEPFFTTKALGEGSGLGLATVYGVARQTNGIVWAESELGKGSVFRVLLPLSDVGGSAGEAETASDAADRSSALVMVVEDEQAVRTSVVRMLRRRGYEVVDAANGNEALSVWQERGDDIRAVVSDVVMPGMRGPALTAQLRAERPELPVVFMSGYTADALSAPELTSDHTMFLRKPFMFDELDSALQRLLAGR